LRTEAEPSCKLPVFLNSTAEPIDTLPVLDVSLLYVLFFLIAHELDSPVKGQFIAHAEGYARIRLQAVSQFELTVYSHGMYLMI
jgi:hypothetical protein